MSDASGGTDASQHEAHGLAVLDARGRAAEQVQPNFPVVVLLTATALSIVVLALIGFALAPTIERALRDVAAPKSSLRQPSATLPSAAAPSTERAWPSEGPSPTVREKARLVTVLGEVFTEDYYPAAAKRDGVEGRTQMLLSVDASGSVTECRVTQSSGNAELDSVTCRLALRKIRYAPARDRLNRPVASRTPMAVRWQLRDL